MKRLVTRDDYVTKLQAMTGGGTTCGVYICTTGNTPKDPKNFCDFRYQVGICVQFMSFIVLL